jgi:hypothetical protein
LQQCAFGSFYIHLDERWWSKSIPLHGLVKAERWHHKRGGPSVCKRVLAVSTVQSKTGKTTASGQGHLDNLHIPQVVDTDMAEERLDILRKWLKSIHLATPPN